MRIPSSIYKSPAGIDGNAPDAVGKGVDSKTADGPRENVAKRDAVETRVQVSRHAQQLATDNALDLAKIERLRASLDAGSFRVDARAIAARIASGE